LVQNDEYNRQVVNRGLLAKFAENEMMLHVAAETLNNENYPIFIDRDGERFVYVLDSVRDGKVSLPISISKGAFLSDLSYYGIEVTDSNLIVVSSCTCASQLLLCMQNHGKHMERLDFEKRMSTLCEIECHQHIITSSKSNRWTGFQIETSRFLHSPIYDASYDITPSRHFYGVSYTNYHELGLAKIC
jgi:BTB/POZ domain